MGVGIAVCISAGIGYCLYRYKDKRQHYTLEGREGDFKPYTGVYSITTRDVFRYDSMYCKNDTRRPLRINLFPRLQAVALPAGASDKRHVPPSQLVGNGRLLPSPGSAVIHGGADGGGDSVEDVEELGPVPTSGRKGRAKRRQSKGHYNILRVNTDTGSGFPNRMYQDANCQVMATSPLAESALATMFAVSFASNEELGDYRGKPASGRRGLNSNLEDIALPILVTGRGESRASYSGDNPQRTSLWGQADIFPAQIAAASTKGSRDSARSASSVISRDLATFSERATSSYSESLRESGRSRKSARSIESARLPAPATSRDSSRSRDRARTPASARLPAPATSRDSGRSRDRARTPESARLPEPPTSRDSGRSRDSAKSRDWREMTSSRQNYPPEKELPIPIVKRPRTAGPAYTPLTPTGLWGNADVTVPILGGDDVFIDTGNGSPLETAESYLNDGDRYGASTMRDLRVSSGDDQHLYYSQSDRTNLVTAV